MIAKIKFSSTIEPTVLRNISSITLWPPDGMPLQISRPEEFRLIPGYGYSFHVDGKATDIHLNAGGVDYIILS